MKTPIWVFCLASLFFQILAESIRVQVRELSWEAGWRGSEQRLWPHMAQAFPGSLPTNSILCSNSFSWKWPINPQNCCKYLAPVDSFWMIHCEWFWPLFSHSSHIFKRLISLWASKMPAAYRGGFFTGSWPRVQELFHGRQVRRAGFCSADQRCYSQS